jgi:hypothetical protein
MMGGILGRAASTGALPSRVEEGCRLQARVAIASEQIARKNESRIDGADRTPQFNDGRKPTFEL